MPADPGASESKTPDFRTLVELMPAIVYAASPDNHTTYVSPQVESILGIPVERWLDDPGMWRRLLHPDDRERVLATYAENRRRGRGFRCEYRLVREAASD